MPPTNTPVPPTTTPVPPTETPVPPTETPVPEPTATPVPPTETPIPPTNTPAPQPPTNTPVPPTATLVEEVTIAEPEPEVLPKPPAEDAVLEEPTVEPTATPVPSTATPIAPTATAIPTSTSTSTPVVIAAVAEPPSTAGPSSEPTEPIEPTGEIEVASSLLTDPSPFVLLGTLLFALAAAAGQVLRSDPMLIRRLVTGFDGVRGVSGSGAGSGPSTQAVEAGDGPRDPPTRWSDGFDTVAGNGQMTHPASMAGDLSTSHAYAHHGAPPMGGDPGAGLGGHGGGLDSLAKVSPSGFDGFASGNPGGVEASSFGDGDPGVSRDVAANAGGQVPDIQADALSQDGLRPTDWGIGDPAPAEPVAHSSAGGSLGGGGGTGGGDIARVPGGTVSELANAGLGGSQGGDVMARGVGASGDVLANGAGGSGNGFAQASAVTGDPGTAGTGLGGSHGMDGGGGNLARGLTPSGDLANMASSPDAHCPAPPHGVAGQAELAESLETIARTLSSPDASGLNQVEATASAAGDQTVAESGFGPSWLGAGALARAPRLDPLPKTFRCPACHKPLVYGHRFCGYCGEPLDKTMA